MSGRHAAVVRNSNSSRRNGYNGRCRSSWCSRGHNGCSGCGRRHRYRCRGRRRRGCNVGGKCRRHDHSSSSSSSSSSNWHCRRVRCRCSGCGRLAARRCRCAQQPRPARQRLGHEGRLDAQGGGCMRHHRCRCRCWDCNWRGCSRRCRRLPGGSGRRGHPARRAAASGAANNHRLGAATASIRRGCRSGHLPHTRRRRGRCR